MQFYTGKMIHRFHCLWMFFNRSFPQSVDKRKRHGSGKKFDGTKSRREEKYEVIPKLCSNCG